MRNLSSFIASTAQHGERRSMGAWAAGAFVAVLLAGSALAAYMIGNSISGPGAGDPPPMAFVDEGF